MEHAINAERIGRSDAEGLKSLSLLYHQQLPYLHESMGPQHLSAGSRMEHLKRADVIVRQGEVVVRLDEEVIVKACAWAVIISGLAQYQSSCQINAFSM